MNYCRHVKDLVTYNDQFILYIEAIPREHVLRLSHDFIVHQNVSDCVEAIESQYHKLVVEIFLSKIEIQLVGPILQPNPTEINVIVGEEYAFSDFCVFEVAVHSRWD
jgi:hypothetical protein